MARVPRTGSALWRICPPSPVLARGLWLFAFVCACDAGGGVEPDAGDAAAQHAFQLDGEWDDNGRRVSIAQHELEVVGTYLEPLICDLDSGSVPIGAAPLPQARVQQTTEDFHAQLARSAEVLPGDELHGETNTCRYGFDPEDGIENGLVLATMRLQVLDRDTLIGSWSIDNDGDGTDDAGGPIRLERR